LKIITHYFSLNEKPANENQRASIYHSVSLVVGAVESGKATSLGTVEVVESTGAAEFAEEAAAWFNCSILALAAAASWLSGGI
jgi:hypothetical protein